MESTRLHQIAYSIREAIWKGTQSTGQDWLFDQCVSELEYRRRRHRQRGELRCDCDFCVPNPVPAFPPSLGPQMYAGS